METEKLIKLMTDEEALDKNIERFMKLGLLRMQEANSNEILGHIAKAEHNMSFILDSMKNYSDWAVVGCYYASYHIALALLLKKGYFSKNHDATLCILLKYYRKELSDGEIEMLNKIYLNNEDILFYVHSRGEREKASYSTQILFDEKSISDLRGKTLEFVDKCKDILNNRVIIKNEKEDVQDSKNNDGEAKPAVNNKKKGDENERN